MNALQCAHGRKKDSKTQTLPQIGLKTKRVRLPSLRMTSSQKAVTREVDLVLIDSVKHYPKIN